MWRQKHSLLKEKGEDPMAPLIYVGTTRVKPGRLEALRTQLAELVDFVETNEPRMIAFHTFLDEPGETLGIVQVHPDSASMEFHMQVNARHFATAWDNLDTSITEQYYGPVSPGLAAELAKWDDPAVSVVRLATHQGGFTRSSVR
jgi:quinol monooxygenase YgiN